MLPLVKVALLLFVTINGNNPATRQQQEKTAQPHAAAVKTASDNVKRDSREENVVDRQRAVERTVIESERVGQEQEEIFLELMADPVN